MNKKENKQRKLESKVSLSNGAQSHLPQVADKGLYCSRHLGPMALQQEDR